jgi:hypothetical protein
MKRLAALLLLLCSSLARAQPAHDLALGRQEFDAGRAEFDLGHYEAALEHFERSYRLTALPALLIDIGRVRRLLFDRTRDLAQLADAIERLEAFLAATQNDHEPRNEARRARAEKMLAEARQLLARERADRARGEGALDLGDELVKSGALDDAQAQLDKFERARPRALGRGARAHAARTHRFGARRS